MKLHKFFFIFILIITYFLFVDINFAVIPEDKMEKTNIKIPADTARLYAHVEYLTTIFPQRSHHNTKSLNIASQYIFDEFFKLNCTVEFQDYKDTVNNLPFRNVIASFNTDAKKRIVIGAHYDVYQNFPGADDNASGIAGILEIARLVDSLKPDLKYRLDFVAYSTEEPIYFRTNLMGSAIHVNLLKQENAKIKLMVCLDMIGYYSERPNSQKFPSKLLKAFYPKTGNFIAVIGKFSKVGLVSKFKRNMKKACNIDVQSINAPSFVQGIDFSDHRNYWLNNYNAVFITNTAFYRNPNYHKISDRIETLDFEKMNEVVKGLYWAIIKN